MFKKDDFEKYAERERLGASAYLASYVDFLKWSTTITLAAVAWVSTSGGFLFHTSTLASLGALAASLLFAVLGLSRVVSAYARDWDLASLQRSYALLDLFEASQADKTFIKSKKKELDDRFQQLSSLAPKFTDSASFNTLLVLHVVALGLGVLLMALDQLMPIL